MTSHRPILSPAEPELLLRFLTINIEGKVKKKKKKKKSLTQFVPGGEDGRAQTRVIVGVGKGCEIVLKPSMSDVERHQAAAHSQE